MMDKTTKQKLCIEFAYQIISDKRNMSRYSFTRMGRGEDEIYLHDVRECLTDLYKQLSNKSMENLNG